MTKEAVSKAFRGNKRLHGKTTPLYPESVEREYQRIADAYMKILNDVMKENLADLRKIAQEEDVEQYRADGLKDIVGKVVDLFASIGMKVAERLSFFGLQEKVEKMASATQKHSISEWKKEVHETLGINILEDYYTGDFYSRQLEVWTGQNVDLISSIPQNSLEKMKNIVLEGYLEGKPSKTVIKEIQNSYSVDKRKACFIARDQLAKLNSNITQHQHRDAGVSKYRWSTSMDSRVREGHKSLNGKEFSWDEPPIVDKKGRRCHPGEDYECRCVAIPVFDLDTIDLPILPDKKGENL